MLMHGFFGRKSGSELNGWGMDQMVSGYQFLLIEIHSSVEGDGDEPDEGHVGEDEENDTHRYADDFVASSG
jgi:hypothetical protein